MKSSILVLLLISFLPGICQAQEYASIEPPGLKEEMRKITLEAVQAAKRGESVSAFFYEKTPGKTARQQKLFAGWARLTNDSVWRYQIVEFHGRDPGKSSWFLMVVEPSGQKFKLAFVWFSVEQMKIEGFTAWGRLATRQEMERMWETPY